MWCGVACPGMAVIIRHRGLSEVWAVNESARALHMHRYHVNGKPQYPGPVIRVKAGSRCAIRLTNSLPPLAPEEAMMCSPAAEDMMVSSCWLC